MSGKHYFGAPAHLRRAQAICDQVQAEFRAEQAAGDRPSIRRDAPPLDPALIPTDDELRLRLAQELDYARRMLDAMGDELTADMSVVMRHGVAPLRVEGGFEYVVKRRPVVAGLGVVFAQPHQLDGCPAINGLGDVHRFEQVI